MTHRIRPIIAIFLIAGGAQLAGAAGQNDSQVWRCAGNRYADRPCPGGQALDAADPRSDADRRAADAATRRDHAQAQALERDRLRRAGQARREGGAIVLDARRAGPPATMQAPAPKPKQGGKRGKKAGPAPEYFTAAGPKAPKAPRP